MIPFIPHLANECLEIASVVFLDKWPEIDTNKVLNEIKLVIQIKW